MCKLENPAEIILVNNVMKIYANGRPVSYRTCKFYDDRAVITSVTGFIGKYNYRNIDCKIHGVITPIQSLNNVKELINNHVQDVNPMTKAFIKKVRDHYCGYVAITKEDAKILKDVLEYNDPYSLEIVSPRNLERVPVLKVYGGISYIGEIGLHTFDELTPISNFSSEEDDSKFIGGILIGFDTAHPNRNYDIINENDVFIRNEVINLQEKIEEAIVNEPKRIENLKAYYNGIVNNAKEKLNLPKYESFEFTIKSILRGIEFLKTHK